MSGRSLLPLAAAIIPLLLFWHTTGFGFLLDDYVLFQKSASLEEPASIAKGFATDVGALRKGSDTVLGSYYRPVFLALSTLYYQAAGGQPFAWHLAAVALAAAIGALACLFFLRLGVPPLLALLASLVFSLHPAHVSSVAWASGLQELLAAFFVLAALLALLRRPGAEGDRRAVAAATVAFILALLSKEVAIGLLPLAAVWAFARRGTDPGESRRFGRAAAVFAFVTLIYLAVRLAVLGGLANPWPHAPGFAASIPSIPVAFVAYLRLLVWPGGFSIFRPERPVWGPLDGPVLLALLAVIALVLLAAVAIRKQRGLLLPAAWLVVWLLPVLNFWALDPQWMVTDRYLFLPALALPWLLILLLPRRFSIAALALLTIVFGALSLRYAAIFRDERTFVAAMEKAEPTSPLIFSEKARLLLREGRTAAAEAALQRAVELNPQDAGTLRRLGDLELQRGDLAAAEAHYRRALAEDPQGSRWFKLLALALSRAGLRPRGGVRPPMAGGFRGATAPRPFSRDEERARRSRESLRGGAAPAPGRSRARGRSRRRPRAAGADAALTFLSRTETTPAPPKESRKRCCGRPGRSARGSLWRPDRPARARPWRGWFGSGPCICGC